MRGLLATLLATGVLGQTISVTPKEVDPKTGQRVTFASGMTEQADKIWFQTEEEPNCDPYLPRNKRTNIVRAKAAGQETQFDFNELENQDEQFMFLCRYTYSGVIKHSATLLTVAPAAGFDFGSCGGGNGTFELTLPNDDDIIKVGDIPPDKVNIRINLTSQQDIDVRLYNHDDLSLDEYKPQGKAIVAWCEPLETCNAGYVQLRQPVSGQAFVSAGGALMIYRYSGYNGDWNGIHGSGSEGSKGNEWVEVTGTNQYNLWMEAYAYNLGSALVTYEWSDTDSPCCQGVADCTGSFQREVKENAVISLGLIPPGKLNLEIRLESEQDIDVQLIIPAFNNYVMVAYCSYSNTECTQGKIYQADETSYSFGANVYTYSGFNGDCIGANSDGLCESGSKGNEWIRITGTTQFALRMKVFGYDAGNATVSYSYREVPPS